VLGAAVGALVRNQVLGVVTLLVVNFAVLPLVSGASESLGNLTPFGASSVLSGMTHDTTLTTTAAASCSPRGRRSSAAAAVAGERRRDLA
jgi:hypothetical protein